MKRALIAGLTAAVLLSVAVPAHAADVATTPRLSTTTTTIATAVENSSCQAQVAAIAARTGTAADLSLCDASVTLTETTFPVSSAQARTIAAQEGMSASATSAFVAAAAAGAVQGATWSHSYNALWINEVHKGTTYWDGSRAWIATYRGLTGSHTCHQEGSWVVGGAVKVNSCNKPGAGASADAVENFDMSVIYQGFPLAFTVGLHYKITATGARSTWQVGG